MICPHHHRIFAAQPRRHSDLPLRLAEFRADAYTANATLVASVRAALTTHYTAPLGG